MWKGESPSGKKEEEKQRVQDMAKRALGFATAASAKKTAQNTTMEQLVDNDERPNHNKRKMKRGVWIIIVTYSNKK